MNQGLPSDPAPGPPVLPLVVAKLIQALKDNQLDAVRVCFHESMTYASPHFPDLRKEMVLGGWRAIFNRISVVDLKTECQFADERKIQLAWTLFYRRFGSDRLRTLSGRSAFSLWDDLIVRQVDEYTFGTWARSYWPLIGGVLSLLPGFQKYVQGQMMSQLHADMKGLS
jgi:hypothetical protein